jgi:hypothetical protein
MGRVLIMKVIEFRSLVHSQWHMKMLSTETRFCDMKDFVPMEFVIIELVITELVIMELVIMELVITEFVVLRVDLYLKTDLI